MSQPTIVEFDLDRYLRNSKKVDLSGIDWEEIPNHPLSNGDVMCLQSHPPGIGRTWARARTSGTCPARASARVRARAPRPRRRPRPRPRASGPGR